MLVDYVMVALAGSLSTRQQEVVIGRGREVRRNSKTQRGH